MQFVIGSATTLAVVFLIIAITCGPSTVYLRKLRHFGYILSCAIAAAVTLGDPDAFALLLAPTLALYEATAWIAR